MSTVDLVGMENPINEMPKAKLENFELSCQDYISITKKLVARHAPSLRPDLAREILRSDDAISNIATEVMMADWKWNGHGTKHGYRKQRAIWAMQSYMSRSNSFNKKHSKYMDELFTKSKFKNNLWCPLEAQEEHQPEVEVEQEEIRSKIKRDVEKAISALDDRHKACVELYYIHGLTMQETADKIGRTRQRVKQILDEALPILEKRLARV